jgi:molybdenum cofactor cytidylyltransferase
MSNVAAWRSIAVVPAAGASRRMGASKLLLPWRGKTIIEHVLDAWSAGRVDHVVVVVRAGDQALVDAIRRCKVEAAFADPPPEEMKDSVAIGLEFARRMFAPGPQDVWLLAPADMPRLSPVVIDRLLAEHDPRSPQILVPRAGERNGHPVLFPWDLAREVSKLTAIEGINVLRQRFPWRAVPIDDSAVFDDLDTPEDYQNLADA